MRSWASTLVVAAILFLASAWSAQADLFTFTVSGPDVTGSGTLTGTPVGALYDATGATGSVTIFGQRFDAMQASGTFSPTMFQLQLYDGGTAFPVRPYFADFRGTDTGGVFYSMFMRLGFYDAFDVQSAPIGGGGAPLPEAGVLSSLVLLAGVGGLVALRRIRTA